MMGYWSITDKSRCSQTEISQPATTLGFPTGCIFLCSIRSRCIYASTAVYFVAWFLLYHKACYFVAMRRAKTPQTRVSLVSLIFFHPSSTFKPPSPTHTPSHPKNPPQHFSWADELVFMAKLKQKGSSRGSTWSVVALASASHNESLKCERLKMQKHRRRPDTCHPFHPEVSLTHTCTCARSLGFCFVYSDTSSMHFSTPL